MSFMQTVLLRLFGHKPANKEPMPPIRFNVTYPKDQPPEDEWLKEFNVGRMWDRKIVHIK